MADADLKPPQWKVLVEGPYHKGEAPLQPGSGWFGLTKVNGGWMFKPVVVSAEKYNDEIADGPNEKSGVQISSSVKESDILMRHPKIKAGTVKVPQTADGKLEHYFNAGEKPFRVIFNGLSYDFSIEKFPKERYRKIVLESDGKRTLLGSFTDHTDEGELHTSISWMGDLDRDGRLDVITNTGDNNSGGRCVFLSSSSPSQRVVQLYACHTGSGC